MKTIITISRQLGSGGSYIAAEVAKAHNLRYLDREVIQRAVELAGYSSSAFSENLTQELRIPEITEKMIEAIMKLPPVPAVASATIREEYALDQRLEAIISAQGLTREEALRQLQAEQRAEASPGYAVFIQRLVPAFAEIGDVVIVGRGGQVLLQEHPGALHVRVHAPESLRIWNLMQRLGIDRKEAERQIHQSDRQRARFLAHLCQKVWDDPILYHIIINMGKVSREQAVALVNQMVLNARGDLPLITG